ncbi:replication protein [Fictibacillus sp. 23RED33]|uniref:replication protein n=1 Tax=Fictibacillus sp. 23RED33 TaxID=2745879 RepID=UPI0018CECCC6|nr:replication protein [Fictibacillus sp. 23RED33]MBH0176243.1 replication protein [Fictibacillus sp. 23RED33]
MENLNAYERARYHTWFHHNEADGYITLAKKTKKGFQQFHVKPKQLALKLSKWLGEDVYFSQNTFYKPQRQIELIRQLRSLYVDLDCYLLNYDPKWIIGKLELEFFNQSIPEPSLIIFSGRGVVLVWLIDPVPYQALPLWQAVQNHFVQQLKAMGGDTRATDAARVFRLDGSINSKNGEAVQVQYRHDYRYVLRDIQNEYLPDLQPKKKTRGRRKTVERLFNTYSLHHARLLDLVKLVELRNFDVKGYRETILFLYRYWQCCYVADPEEALRQTLIYNSQFLEPLAEKEVIRATKSAEKAWKAKNSEEANTVAKEKGYPGAGYNLKNAKIIGWLDITEDEQVQLQTIIGRNEKRKRNTEAKREQRRREGMKPRKAYLDAQKEKTEDKLWLLQKAINKYPDTTHEELAKLLNIERSYVSKLLKRL